MTVVALGSLDRYDRVDVPALDLELTIVDVLGSYFGTGVTGVVGVDDRDRRYLIAYSDDRSGIRVERWTGLTYRDELHAGSLEAGSGKVDAVVPAEGSRRVDTDKRVLAGV